MKPTETIYKILPNNSGKYISELQAKKMLDDKYQRQAIDFLLETETICDISLAGLDKPNWGKTKVNKYEVTLKNKKHSWTFNFWDSVSNTEKNKSPSLNFYAILACLDLDYSSDFDDFCSNFGYEFKTEREFIKAKEVYFSVIDQDKNLKKLFTEDQLQKLSEIN